MMLVRFDSTNGVINLKQSFRRSFVSKRLKSSWSRYLLIALSFAFVIWSYPNFAEMLVGLYFLIVIISRLASKWTFGLVILTLLALVAASSLHFAGLAVTLGNYVFIFLLIAVISGLLES